MAKRQKAVCFDLDDTICNFLPLLCHLHNKLYGTCLSESDITDWNFDELDVTDVRGNRVTGKQLRETFRSYEPNGLYSCLPVIDDSKRALKMVEYLGYKIILITARKAEYEAQTRLNIIANDIHHDEIYFNSDKVKQIKELSKKYSVEMFVDDNYENVVAVNENCIVKYCFLMNKAHNRNKSDVEGITRIHNLFDTIRFLKEVK